MKQRVPLDEKLITEVEEEHLAEVQRLSAENAYLKNVCHGCRKDTTGEKAKEI